MSQKKEFYKKVLNEIKELKKNKQIKQPRKRNLHGVSLFPFVWSPNYNLKDEALIQNQTIRNFYCNYVERENGGLILVENRLNNLNKEKILKKSIKDINYISYQKEMTDLIAKQLLKFSSYNLSPKNISLSSSNELWSYYLMFKKIYEEYEFYSSIWFMISDDYYNYVETELLKLNISQNDINILLTPSFISVANQETIAFQNILNKINSDKNLKEISINKDIKSLKKSILYKLILDIVNKFYWLPFSHNGPDLYDENYYITQIFQHFDSKNIDNKEELIKSNINERIRIKNEIITKYKLNNFILDILNNLETLSKMQDVRKEIIAKSHIYWTNNLMGTIGKKLGLSPQDTANLLPNEIKEYLLTKRINLNEYERRKNAKFIFYILTSKELYYYIDEEAIDIRNILAEENNEHCLKGIKASPGIIKSNAKIVLSTKDFNKVENGDIIITTMTTPEFIPVLRKAKGVITEEGGITCHAAIITRELKIPCIIDVKNITNIIKDNSEILLDADNNIITILKNGK